MENDALRSRFEAIDTDGNGRIDAREFGRLLDALGLGYTDQQKAAAFADIDLDQNGCIDFGEFCAWWTAGH